MHLIKLLFISIIITMNLSANTIDPTTGLIIDKGLSDIKENCTICHTGRFIVVNGGDKTFWRDKIKAMQDGFGLWELTPQQKERILTYLSKNYAQRINVSIDE